MKAHVDHANTVKFVCNAYPFDSVAVSIFNELEFAGI